MSNNLSGVVFEATVEGENKPPCQQTDIAEDERLNKEAMVFNTALDELSAYWKNVTFDGFDISVEPVHCREDQLVWNDYDKVKEFLSCPLNQLHKYPELTAEFKQMFLHLDRHLNEIVFVKCNDGSCCLSMAI